MDRLMKIPNLALVLATLIALAAPVYAYGLPQPPSVIINIMVYATDGDKNFHRSGCGLLYGKQITGIALGKAYQEGYSPCGQCEPPQIKRDYWSQVEETNWGTLCPPLRPTRRDKLFPEMQHHFRDFAKMIRTGYIV